MRTAKQLLDEQFLEMRWRCLSLAADLDRLQNTPGGSELLRTDLRLDKLRQAISALSDSSGHRAERVQMIFSEQIK